MVTLSWRTTLWTSVLRLESHETRRHGSEDLSALSLSIRFLSLFFLCCFFDILDVFPAGSSSYPVSAASNYLPKKGSSSNGAFSKKKVIQEGLLGVTVILISGILHSTRSVERTFQRYLRFSDAERKAKDNVLIPEGKSVEFEGQETNHAPRVHKRFLDHRFDGQDFTQLKNLEEELESELKQIRSRRRALLKDAGAYLPRPVMDGACEGADEEEEPGGDCTPPAGPSRTLRLFADV